MSFFSSLFKRNYSAKKTVNNWLNEYIKILAERNLKPKTIEIKNYLIVVIRQQIGNKNIRDITPPDITKIIKIYIDQDKAPSAKCMYHLLKDIFREAWAQGWNNKNPVDPIKCPKVMVKRSRIILSEFKKLVDAADKKESLHFIRDAMLAAVVTGQRRGDVSTMKKTDIKRNYLFIKQQKTGSKIAIPIKLKCKKIGLSVQDIINMYPSVPYIVTRKGRAISPDEITRGFAKVRDAVFNRSHWTGAPATFHEIRSLSERLYREQRIDTMTLLGHRTQQMTDKYNDNRGREYKKLKINHNLLMR